MEKSYDSFIFWQALDYNLDYSFIYPLERAINSAEHDGKDIRELEKLYEQTQNVKRLLERYTLKKFPREINSGLFGQVFLGE